MQAKRTIAVVLCASLLGLAGAVNSPLPAAGAAPPWDVAGAAWTGTLTSAIHRKTTSSSRVQVYDEQATYTELEPQSASANGNYSARIQGSGTEKDYQAAGCGDMRLANDITWHVDKHFRSGPLPVVLAISTDDIGQTTISPRLAQVDISVTGYECDGDAIASTSSTTVLGFQSGESGAFGTPDPVPDTNGDLYRLQGTKTWTLADPPYPLYANTTEFTFTLTYDLTLEQNPCIGGSQAAYPAYQASIAPDKAAILHFELDAKWCRTRDGVIFAIADERRRANLELAFRLRRGSGDQGPVLCERGVAQASDHTQWRCRYGDWALGVLRWHAPTQRAKARKTRESSPRSWQIHQARGSVQVRDTETRSPDPHHRTSTGESCRWCNREGDCKTGVRRPEQGDRCAT